MPEAAVSRSRASRSLALIVVSGGLILFLCLGQRHSFGLFLAPMSTDMGWGRETFSFAIALQNLVWGLAQPFAGMAADRLGAVRVLLAGAVCYAAGLALMPYSTDGLTLALSAGVLIGVGLSGTAFGIVYGAVGRLVPPASRGTALGIVGALGSFGLFAMLPLNHLLIAQLGWSAALIALSALCALMIPLAFGVPDRGGAAAGAGQQSMPAALREAFGHSGFWLLTAGFLTCGFQLAFIGVHLPAFLQDRGHGPEVAVTALAVVALFNVAGTYLCGYYGERLSRKRLLAALYLVRGGAIAAFALLPVSPATIYPFCAVMGLLWLGTVPLTTGLIGKIFGMRYVSTLFGFVFLSHQIGSFAGVWLGGHLFDATGSYDLAWLVAAALGLFAAVMNWPIDDREIVRPQVAAA
ncbi:MAG TPA: MFS transporter [Burkholderiaceae bacterium]|nr:MFS transporter [Burkholderiaceae bacterium]